MMSAARAGAPLFRLSFGLTPSATGDLDLADLVERAGRDGDGDRQLLLRRIVIGGQRLLEIGADLLAIDLDIDLPVVIAGGAKRLLQAVQVLHRAGAQTGHGPRAGDPRARSGSSWPAPPCSGWHPPSMRAALAAK